MSRIRRGPFTLKWGDNVIADVEEVDITHEVDSEEYQTIQGNVLEVDGVYKSGAIITLLATDIPSLSLLLPQYFVPNGGQLSTGETVNNADGAIDIRAAACDTELIFDHFDIIDCGNPSETTRIPRARTRIESLELDNKIKKVMIKLINESENGGGTLQIFRTGSVQTVS